MSKNTEVAESHILLADETWIATALLHRENPSRANFTISEIVSRAARENLHGSLREGLKVHASLHCVANKAPNPAPHRMLYATGRHTRRLYRAGDVCHPKRTGKTMPNRDDIPAAYHELLDWYESGYNGLGAADSLEADPILALAGTGRGMWGKGEHPDEHVRRLREGW